MIEYEAEAEVDYNDLQQQLLPSLYSHRHLREGQ